MKRKMYLLLMLCWLGMPAVMAETTTLDAKTFTLEYDTDKWRVTDLGVANNAVPDAYIADYQPFEEHAGIVVFDVDMDFDVFFQQQIMERKNRVFQDVAFLNEPKEATLWGVDVRFVLFEKIVEGKKYTGTVVAGKPQNKLAMAYVLSTDMAHTGFGELVEHMVFKQNTPEVSFEQRMTDLSAMLTANKPMVGENLRLISVVPDFAQKTMSYTYRFETASKKDINTAVLNKWLLLPELVTEYDNNPQTKELMDRNFTFLYSYVDQNNEPVITLQITPDDYWKQLGPRVSVIEPEEAPEQEPVSAPEPEPNDGTVFLVAEEMPSFPSGQQAMFRFLQETIKYPVICEENGIEGKAICQFVVEKDGTLSTFEVVRSSGNPSLDKEAIRVLKAMPNWTPGKHRGKNVRVRYTVPVNFRLTAKEETKKATK